MILKKYNSIMQKSDNHRMMWALGLASTFSIFIFMAFGFSKGFITLEMAPLDRKEQVATVVSAELAPAPFSGTKDVFSNLWDGTKKQYSLFVESMASVFVPFVTSIEVYER